MYRLKKGIEKFQVVDGPFAGRKFEAGKAYDEIPAGKAKKFEKIPAPAAGETGQESKKGRTASRDRAHAAGNE